MRPRPLPLLLSVVTLLLSGCVSWQYGGAAYTARSGDYALQVPSDWLYLEQPAGQFRATKDSLFIQRIEVERRDLKQALPNSKRALAHGQTPLELAEAVLDDLKLDRQLLQPAVVRNEPATLGGQPGFRFTVNYQTADKLRLSLAVYGCIQGERLYLLKLTAPTRFYFERDQVAFDAAAASFRFVK